MKNIVSSVLFAPSMLECSPPARSVANYSIQATHKIEVRFFLSERNDSSVAEEIEAVFQTEHLKEQLDASKYCVEEM